MSSQDPPASSPSPSPPSVAAAMPSRVAIIGGGVSGLVAAKSALECGMRPVGFEKSATLFGLWSTSESGVMWDSLRTNVSHATCSFSDFPWPSDSPDFAPAADMRNYLERYAKHFGVDECFRVKTKVTRVERVEGLWRVTFQEDGVDTSRYEDFDFLLICSGVFSTPSVPAGVKLDDPALLLSPSPSSSAASGPLHIHSSQYRNPLPFVGKDVSVVGGAYSACEIASDLCKSAASASCSSVTLVARTPQWVLPRYLPVQGKEPKPLDLVFYNRKGANATNALPAAEANQKKTGFFQSLTAPQREKWPEEVKAVMEVKAQPTDPTFVCVSDGLTDAISSGRLTCKSSLDAMPQKPSDVVIWCTGFRTSLPYLSDEFHKLLHFDPDDQMQPLLLHEAMWPHADMPNCAFIGMYRGPYLGVVELQARWACMAFGRKGGVNQPSDEERAKGMEAEERIRKSTPRWQFPHGDYVVFCERLASYIGVLPDMSENFHREDPELFTALTEGVFVPAGYRLQGFGASPDLAKREIRRVQSWKQK